jgi:hypothetical protein
LLVTLPQPKSADAQSGPWNITFTFKETAKGWQQEYEYTVNHEAAGKGVLQVSSGGSITGSGTGTTTASAKAFTELGTCTGQGTFSASFSVDGTLDKSTGKAQLRLYGMSPQSTPLKIVCPEGTEGQGELYMPFDTCGSYIPLTLANGISEKGTFAGSMSDCGEDITNSWTASVSGPPQKAKISVVIVKPEINPLSDPTTKVTVKVINEDDGSAVKGGKIDIKVCTSIGGEKTDGHMHDGRADPCDDSRPHGTVKDAKGGKESSKLTTTTDQNGFVNLTYKSPVDKKSKKIVISGQESIIAEMGEVKGEGLITTKVPGLKQMPGSANCKGAGGYTFAEQSQSKHGCLFYGTDATSQSIVKIASSFAKMQKECQKGCTIKDDKGNSVQIKTPGNPKQLVITAMSLPWGGLLDINRNWSPPHSGHYDGKGVDIDVGTMKNNAGQPDTDRITLLRYIIMQEKPNFKKFESGEGDTVQSAIKAKHIHVYFNK